MELKIKNLSKSYGQTNALSDINIQLSTGIYGLLGPNGAGKSTLINLITDNVKRKNGEILWDGTEICRMGSSYRNILGYMPQQQGYYEDFTAGAFLAYMCRIKGIKGKKVKECVSRLLQIVHLSELEYKKIGTFSGGMKQRILLAQALINEPKLLILDEPTAGVDPQERISIRNFISEIANDRIVILATHIVSDVEAIAKEILLLKKGRLIARGTPYELINQIAENVYEIQIPTESLPEIHEQYTVSNIRHIENGLAVKIITDKPPEKYRYDCGTANLEDVYLNYFE